MRVALLVALQVALVVAQLEITSRLPSWQTPIHYDLAVHPVFDSDNTNPFPYYGEVAIHLNLTEASNVLVVHYYELNIDSISLYKSSDGQFKQDPVATNYSAEWEQLQIEFEAVLPPDDDYVLFITFSAELRDDLFGFYRAEHAGQDGLEWVASTQFSSVHARWAFPCLDQPNMKATFQVTLVGDSPTLLTNMPPVEGGEDVAFDPDRASPFLDFYDGEKVTTGRLGGSTPFPDPTRFEREVVFQTTPIMYTGILVWVFCDYESTEPVFTNRGIPVRVWAPKGQAQYGTHARDFGKGTLEFYEDTFELLYPLPKLDIITIPDFYFAAMENWGLVTFATSYALYNPDVDTVEQLNQVSNVVSHEVSHSWFGNTVTEEWWDDVWLHEGFADYLAVFGVAAVHPEWSTTDQIGYEQYIAMLVDGYSWTQPMKTPTWWETPLDLQGVFTYQAYFKGASLLAMFAPLMSEDLKADIGSDFWQALVEYLAEFEYDNAESEDLFTIFEQSDRNGVVDWSAMFDSWLLGQGVPWLDVEKVSGGVNVTQRRFTSDPPYAYDDMYYIPITYYTGDKRNLVVMTDQESTIHIPLETRNGGWRHRRGCKKPKGRFSSKFGRNSRRFCRDDDNVLKLSVDGAGYYRTRYSDELLDEIVELLSDPHESPYSTGDRVSLLHDMGTFADGLTEEHELYGADSAIQFFKLMTYIPKAREVSYEPWYFATRWGLSPFHGRLTNREFAGVYESYGRYILSKAVDYVGFDAVYDTSVEPQEFERSRLRQDLLWRAVLFKYRGIKRDAYRLLGAYLEDGESIHHEVFDDVWNAAASFGDRFFDTFVNISLDASHPDQASATTALGYTRHGPTIARLLDLMIDGSYPLSLSVIGALVENNLSSLQVLEWALANWQPLCEALCDTSADDLFSILLGHLDNESEKSLVQEFFEAEGVFLGTTGAAADAYQAQLATIDANIDYMNEVGRPILSYLQTLALHP